MGNCRKYTGCINLYYVYVITITQYKIKNNFEGKQRFMLENIFNFNIFIYLMKVYWNIVTQN